MLIRQLRLYHFRNLLDQEVSFDQRLNLIVGKNGQGKTNLIEAINLLSLTHSFRTQRVTDLVRWGESGASVFAQMEDSNGKHELGLAVEGSKRQAFIDGAKVSSITSFVGKLLCVSFSPSDMSLIKGAPLERRRFIDRHAVDIDSALLAQLIAYQRALKHKNALINTERANPEELIPWNKLLAQSAASILRGRSAFLKQLEARASRIYASFGASDGGLRFELHSNLIKGEDLLRREDLPREEELLAQYNEAAAREIGRQSAFLGPHRDESVFLIGGKEARAFASQGQARSLLLALKLGVIELIYERREELPLILLDDVDSELDQERSQALFELIKSEKGQVFVTGTSLSGFKQACSGTYQLMRIESGRISLE